MLLSDWGHEAYGTYGSYGSYGTDGAVHGCDCVRPMRARMSWWLISRSCGVIQGSPLVTVIKFMVVLPPISIGGDVALFLV